MHRAGAQRVGDFDATHMLSSAHRAALQGWSNATFPTDMIETKRRDLISQVVPPPFATVLAEAVERTVTAETSRTKAEINLVRLNQVPEEDLPKLVDSVLGMREHRAPVELGHFGRWQYLGSAFGWVREDLAQPSVLNALLNAPWNVLHEPPDVNMSVSEWHRANRKRARAEKRRYNEWFDMAKEDTKEKPPEPSAGNGLHRNIHPDPDLVAKRNSNWEKQQSGLRLSLGLPSDRTVGGYQPCVHYHHQPGLMVLQSAADGLHQCDGHLPACGESHVRDVAVAKRRADGR